jgi:hypothetical protein
MWSLLFTLVLAAEGEAPPLGAGLDVEVPPMVDDDEIERIVVIADPFARWDGTRWFIKTEIGLPYELKFFADQNWEFWTSAFQIRTIVACDKDFKISKNRQQVHCTIEDFGIQATDSSDMKTKLEQKIIEKRIARREAAGKPALTESKEERRAHIQAILDEIDTKLSGASLQLQVSSMGRVTNIDLEGVPKDSVREAEMFATLRALLSRVIVGFDMKLENHDFLEQGFWVEYSSALMSIPAPDETSMGSSMLIHRLSKIDGNLIAESRGKGLISIFDDQNFTTSFAGVAVYDEDTAYMTERVWVLKGIPTANTWMDLPYWHAGRIIQLDPDQKPSLGETRLVHLPCCPVEGVAAWIPIED